MESQFLDKRHAAITMIGLMLGVLMSAMDTTVIGTSMPAIIGDLSGMERYSWPFTAYLLCSTLAVPIFGSLADSLGRRLVFLAGIVEFLIASALCGLSRDMTALIVFRGLQGLGGGVIISSAFALVGETFPARERGKYSGLVASMFGISSVIGPSVGGFLTDCLGWRWSFYVNLPLGVIAILVLSLGLAGIKEKRSAVKLDALGAFLFAASIVPFMLALALGGRDYPWASLPVASLLAISVAAGACFVAVERRAASPILPPFLFRNREFVASALATFFSNATFYAGILFLPLYAQEVLHLSASGSAIAITPMLLVYAASSALGGQLCSRIGRYRGIGIAASAIAVLAMGALCLINPSWGALPVVLATIVLGVGLGTTTPIFNIAPQNAFDRRYIGTVTSAIQFFRYVGSAVGSAIFGTLMIASLSSSLKNLDWGRTPAPIRAALDDPKVLMNPSAIKAIGAHTPAQYRPFVDALTLRIDGILAGSIRGVFIAALAFAVLALISVTAYRRGTRLGERARD